MKQWIEALRLRVSLLATLIAVASYRLCEAEIRILPIAATCVICMVTMVQNDYRDRFHDVAKNKTLAYRKPKQFLRFLLLLWACALSMIAVVAWTNLWTGLLLTGMAIVALVYSEVRTIPYMPCIMVSLTSASPALLPLTDGSAKYLSFGFFAAIALANFGREILGDIPDKEIDREYKHTIPSATSLRSPEKLGAILMGMGVSLVPLIHPLGLLVALLPSLVIAALFFLLGDPNSQKRWLWLDLASALLIVGIIVAA